MLAGLVLATVAVGCGDALAPEPVSGIYALAAVNGTTLPATLTVEGSVATFTSGAFVFGADDDTWSCAANASIAGGTTDAPRTYRASGTFEHTESNTVQMTLADGSVTTGTFVSDGLIVIHNGVSLLFSR